jgi:hypothetical protein
VGDRELPAIARALGPDSFQANYRLSVVSSKMDLTHKPAYPMMSQWAAEYDKDKRVEVTPLAADVHFHLRRQPLRRLAPPGMGGRFGPTGGRHAAEFRRPAGDRETGSASEPGRLTWTPAKHVSEWRNLMRQPRMPAKVVQIEAAR